MQTIIAGEVVSLAVSARRTGETGNPFPGLRPFQESEGHLFFGRESQVDTMVDKLAATRLLAVVGTSGSGKSSLVNCGLRPALHRGLMAKAGIDWQMVQFRPGNNPVHELACAMASGEQINRKFDFDIASLQEIIEATLRLSKLGISEVYRRAQLKANLLIVVDQFEELFRYRRLAASTAASGHSFSEEATAFVNLLLEAKRQPDLPIYVVITMRSDFLGDCAEFLGLPEAINEGQYLIPRLTRDERRAAIAGPIGVGGAKISPVLLTQLVNDVGDNPDQLSIQQHALNRTWARWQHGENAEGEITLSHYEAIGTMEHALDHHAEKAFGELRDERKRRICEKIFKALTDKGTDPRGVRRPTSFGTLCDLAQATPADVGEIIDVFRKPSRSFLMPPIEETLNSESDFSKVVDISHESFMRIWERLKKWTEEEVQSACLYRRLIETAALHADKKAGLWGDPELQLALGWKVKEEPTEAWAKLYGGNFAQAMDFLAQSEDQHNRKIQEKEEMRQRELRQTQELAEARQQRIEEQARSAHRMRLGMAALACVAVALILVAGYARNKQRVAQQQTAFATQQTKLADQKAKEALEAKAQTDLALKQADLALARAQEADDEMRLEGLRVRDKNLQYTWQYGDMAGKLREYVSFEEGVEWIGKQGLAFVQVGDLESAERYLSAVLKVSPDDIDARTERGYMYMMKKQPKTALADFEYIRDHIDQGYPLNNLNLTIVQAQLGDYPAASISLKRALASIDSRSFEGAGEDLIPPDVTTALGRTSLQADKATFKTALYYMQANLEAYAGNTKAFESALGEADKQAAKLSPAARKDALLIAMTWAWLHLGVRCPDSGASCRDYSAFASQAALWERIQRNDWAACYYQRFRTLNARWSDSHYNGIAALAGRRLAEVNTAPAEYCLKPPEHNALTLETEAREASTRRDYRKAISLYEQAIAKAPESDQMHLLLDKAGAVMQMGADAERKANTLRKAGNIAGSEKQAAEAKKAFLQARKLCRQLIEQNPREAKAYLYRAYAQIWLDPDSSSSRELVLADAERTLQLDPVNLSALSLVDELVPDSPDDEMVRYLERHGDLLARYVRLSPYSDKAFYHLAVLAIHEGHNKDALKYITQAIDLNPENVDWYDIRKEIQVRMGVSEEDADLDLKVGYARALLLADARGHETQYEKAKKAREEFEKTHPHPTS